MNKGYNLELIKPNLIKISGNIYHENAVEVRKKGESIIDSLTSVMVDLDSLDNIDSSCLSILICWVRYSKKKHKSIKFSQLTGKLLNLSRVSGVDSIFPV